MSVLGRIYKSRSLRPKTIDTKQATHSLQNTHSPILNIAAKSICTHNTFFLLVGYFRTITAHSYYNSDGSGFYDLGNVTVRSLQASHMFVLSQLSNHHGKNRYETGGKFNFSVSNVDYVVC